MPQQSLFSACDKIFKSGTSGTQPVGNYDIDFELYRQSDIDANVEAIARGEATGCTFGDADESKVVLVVDDTVTIPEGFNLTPVSPKKSMVIMCNTLVNNGIISMTGKGPNVEPHDWYILGKLDNYGSSDNIIIPAYANNRATSTDAPCNGIDGTNRQCGSGGSGANYKNRKESTHTFRTGSGYAFGGGAGTGGICNYIVTTGGVTPVAEVDTTYPMRGSRAYSYVTNGTTYAYGGVGNPYGQAYKQNNVTESAVQNFGVGGRLIIYCVNFENNGTMSADGITPKSQSANYKCSGGASGGGAVDLFYTNLISESEGNITANGGSAIAAAGNVSATGNGGNGSITLLNWTIEKVVREEEKVFTRDNVIYLLNELTKKLQKNHIGE